jgi:hypothetical protein
VQEPDNNLDVLILTGGLEEFRLALCDARNWQ